MAKKRATKKTTRKASSKKSKTAAKSKVDSADGVLVGEESMPGMRLRCICRGHQGTIGRIAWSPCGRFIASPSSDKTIRIWDANDGKCLAVFEGHTATVYCVAWSPDGRLLASGGADERVLFFETQVVPPPNGTEPLKELHRDEGNWRKVIDAKQSRDGDDDLRALPADVDNAINLNIGDVYTLAWSGDGNRLACSGEYNAIEVYNTTSLEIEMALEDGPDCMVEMLSWWPTDCRLAASYSDSRIRIWDVNNRNVLTTLEGHSEPQVYGSHWLPDGKSIVSCGDDKTVRVWDIDRSIETLILEGHTDEITGVTSCSHDLIASKSKDGTIRMWHRGMASEIGAFGELSSNSDWGTIAFHPTEPILATLGESDSVLRLWDLDVDLLLGQAKTRVSSHYTSAKIVLVGDSNVGKSCLAMRLAEDRYPKDHEHGTTHGMRFWPMEAEDLHPAAKPPEGQRRDVVLWDFGGQDEYQLVHQMFLHDTTLALVLIDPTRGRASIDEARDWNKQLEKHLGKDRAVKLLVGAKVDKKRELIDQNSIDALCKKCGFAGFLDLSAKTGRNTKRLRKLISDALDWDQMAKTTRPALFQAIRDEIETRRKSGEVVVLLEDLKGSIPLEASQREDGGWHAQIHHEESIEAVSEQLASQGVIVKSTLMTGDETLVLQLPVLERYAGSLIIAARNNPRGVPVLEERLLGSTKTIPLPGMTKKQRLSPAKERIVLECIVELMIQHGICFRHGGLLVFPTLFPSGDADAEPLPHSVSLYYDFTGAIDSIYASLVSKLMVSENFGDGRLKISAVEFDRPGEGVCGIRQIKRSGGLAHVDLYFADETEQMRRDLFTTFVEQHLQSNGVEIREHQAIKCSCGKVIDEDDVQANLAAGEVDVICPRCRARTLISEGVSRIRERDPESAEKLLALRKVIEEKTNQDAARLKQKIATGTPQTRGDDPIRILHLSDLHFTGSTVPKNHLTPLLADLRSGAEFGFDSVDYVVISGDMTDRGGDSGFDKAREFTLELIEELGTDAQKCIFVPGNHDVQDLDTAYRWFGTEDKAREYNRNESRWHREGAVVFVEDRDLYKQRLKRFNDVFFSKVVKGEDYPLNADEQGLSYLYPETGIQFLTLNSAWQIDQFHRNRSGIHAGAINHATAMAEQQTRKAIDNGSLKKNKPLLRLAVWHHALEGKWAMQDDTFLEHVQAANVKLCLHGDVHESRRKLVNWWDRGGVHIVGAGTFGSPEQGRPESTPRLYNVLEVQPNLKSVRVHTREQRKKAGAWKGWYEWPDLDDGVGRVPYFDIDLKD